MISAGTLLMEKSPLLVVRSLYMVWRSLIKVYIDLKDRSHKAMLPPTSNRICPPLLTASRRNGLRGIIPEAEGRNKKLQKLYFDIRSYSFF